MMKNGLFTFGLLHIPILVWFYSISTIAGNLMPNPVLTYILDIWFVNTFGRYTVKWSNSSIANNSI